MGILVLAFVGIVAIGALGSNSSRPKSARAAAPTKPSPTLVNNSKVTRTVESKSRVATKSENEQHESGSPDGTSDQSKTPFIGMWRTYSSKSEIDDSTTVTLALEALTSIQRWPSKQHRPTLYVRHQEGKVSMFIDIGGPPHVERGNSDGATVLLRFGEEPAEEFNTSISTSRESLFFRNPERLIRRLGNGELVTVRFTPFNTAPATTTFEPLGIREAIRPLEEASGWSFE